MALTQGLLDTYWRKYNQRRALTGLPSSYQEQRGFLDPMMEATANKDIQEAQLRYTHDIQNRQLSMQEQAQKDAARAANISGLTGIGALGLGAYSLSKPSIADYLMQKQLADRSLQTQGLNDKLWATGWPNTTVPSVSPPIQGGYLGAGSGGEGILAGAGSGATVPASSAAYTGATGTAAYGSAEGAGPASVLGAEGGGSMLGAAGTAAAYAGAGFLGADLIDRYSPIGGQKEKSIAGNIAKGAGIGAGVGSVVPGVGTAIGAAVGSVIGGVVGFVEDVSVICSELLRQGRITSKDRTKCVVFRFRYIPDYMFMAYLEWAEPIVSAMRKGGWRNALLLPFAHAFVDYMISIQDRKVPTFTQRMVWKYSWWRCEKIARHSEQHVWEVT